MATTIIDKDGASISSPSSMPSDRSFRNAWKIDGTVISEDLAAAKVIFKDKVREVRGPLLDAEDVVWMKAAEADNTSAKAASVAKKVKLRDAPANNAISSASNITELKAAWDTSVLGTSPY